MYNSDIIMVGKSHTEYSKGHDQIWLLMLFDIS